MESVTVCRRLLCPASPVIRFIAVLCFVMTGKSGDQIYSCALFCFGGILLVLIVRAKYEVSMAFYIISRVDFVQKLDFVVNRCVHKAWL